MFDISCNTRYIKGVFQESTVGSKFQNTTLQKTIAPIFTSNWLLEQASTYESGSYFGSFALGSDKMFNGVVINGSPDGWGITVTFSPNPNEQGSFLN